jgi:hypothetical protein
VIVNGPEDIIHGAHTADPQDIRRRRYILFPHQRPFLEPPADWLDACDQFMFGELEQL